MDLFHLRTATAASTSVACASRTASWRPCSKASARSRRSTSRRNGAIAARVENMNDAPEIYSLRARAPRRLTRHQRRVPAQRRARRQGEGGVRERGRHEGRSVRDQAAGLRSRAGSIRRSCTSTAARSASSRTATTSSHSTWRRTATWSSSRIRAARPAAARISSARSTGPGASRTTTTSSPPIDHVVEARLRRSRPARGHGLFLRRLHDQRRHHAHQSLQGGGFRRGTQPDRRQLRS